MGLRQTHVSWVQIPTLTDKSKAPQKRSFRFMVAGEGFEPTTQGL